MGQKWLSFNIFDFVNKLTTDSDCDKRERQSTLLCFGRVYIELNCVLADDAADGHLLL